ncbi:MAG: methyltetrahydrofolate--corrinoid methyltransferase [Planctomycetota bacterium]|nr:MAG: methyltetrahydrofolate--corrinoid methyltransferase [Planctomycetota bacterium]
MTKTVLRGRKREVELTPGKRTYIIGERCNALGYQAVREAVERGDWDLIASRAVAQVAAGADVVNVNMVGMQVPEREALPRAVERIAAAVDAPLSLDFGDLAALEAALAVVPGRALVNSVNGETKKLGPTLQVARRYNAAVIALLCDDRGIPDTAAGRLRVAEVIAQRADAEGFELGDVVFDGVCLGVGTNSTAGQTTLDTCRLLRQHLGANVMLGASNASFGLPRRRTLDAAYLVLAIGAGMTIALTDPTLPALKWSLLSADCCLGYDAHGLRYIRAYREWTRVETAP